jgi:nitroreductase
MISLAYIIIALNGKNELNYRMYALKIKLPLHQKVVILQLKKIKMDFHQLVHHRESTRRYSPRPVEQEKLDLIMEACRMAPSACNSQPWKFVVATDPEIKEALAHATYGPLMSFNKFVPQAPVIAAIVAENPGWLAGIGGKVQDKPYYMMDIGIVASHFCLQAAELGLGTCMLGWFQEKEVHRILKIPSGKRILLLITLGYPENEKTRKKIRKKPEQMWKYNSY